MSLNIQHEAWLSWGLDPQTMHSLWNGFLVPLMEEVGEGNAQETLTFCRYAVNFSNELHVFLLSFEQTFP